VCVGHAQAFYTNIYPFRSRPEEPVRVLFFPVANDTPFIPYPTPNILRFWDKLDQYEIPDWGTKYDPVEYYRGPLPVNSPGEPCGTAEQWMGDIDYDVYMAGGYSCDCPGVILPTYTIDVYSPLESLTIDPHNGHVLVDLNMGHSNTWQAIQNFTTYTNFDIQSIVGDVGFAITGDVGAGPTDLFQVIREGLVKVSYRLQVGPNPGTTGHSMNVRMRVGVGGILINPISGSPITGPFVQCQRGGGSNQFVIDYDGSIWSNQPYAATTLGAVVAGMPIYDADGVLVGYLPIYDSIT